jgi:hypothetical protein
MNTQAATKNSIYTSTACWHEVPRINAQTAHELGDFLEKRINLEAFGSGLKDIWFVALIMQPEDKIHTNQIVFHRKTTLLLELFWRMDYNRVMASTLPEFKAYLAAFFVEVLQIAKEQKRIKNFDMEGFIAAVEKVLPEWLGS